MRTLFAPVHEGILRALYDIFKEGFAADKVIQRQLKLNKKWGSHDRRLFAESVYDIVRWWRRLLHAAGVPWPEEDRWTSGDHEVFLAVVQAWCVLNDVEPGKGIARRPDGDIRARWSDRGLPRAVRESIPDWLDTWAADQLGERWERVLPVLNTIAPVYLRANRLKIKPADLVRELRQEKIEAELVRDDAVRLKARANVWLTRAFKAGHFEMQDLSSQAAAPALDPRPGERIIDACAGAGGKSLHLAALMGNKGKVLALDVAERKLEELRARAARNGASCIETRLIESTKTIKRLEASADRLLLDVPCTGLGVLRRNPDSKWKLTREEADGVIGLQGEILSSYTRMLKPGGRLVYATCSILPAENERQVEAFLSRAETGFKLEGMETFWPEEGGPDGFFVARLSKTS